MKKSDCELIAYILSSSKTLKEAIERLVKLDDRILLEYESFNIQASNEEAIMERMKEKLIDRFGEDWCFKRACTKESVKLAYEESKVEINKEN